VAQAADRKAAVDSRAVAAVNSKAVVEAAEVSEGAKAEVEGNKAVEAGSKVVAAEVRRVDRVVLVVDRVAVEAEVSARAARAAVGASKEVAVAVARVVEGSAVGGSGAAKLGREWAKGGPGVHPGRFCVRDSLNQPFRLGLGRDRFCEYAGVSVASASHHERRSGFRSVSWTRAPSAALRQVAGGGLSSRARMHGSPRPG
jgi:hypothetical protein